THQMLPKQVTVSCVHLTSYGFLQTPPLASDALAIRIVFPLVGMTLLSCKQTGLPALLGKQKKPILNKQYRLLIIKNLSNKITRILLQMPS
ncbi:hypothetical protein, partial [Aliivibrio finisterrensis]